MKIARTLRRLVVAAALAAPFAIPAPAEAQCAMCKAAGEATEDPAEANELGRGLYYSILFMLAMPFTLGGGLVWFIYRHEKGREAAERPSA